MLCADYAGVASVVVVLFLLPNCTGFGVRVRVRVFLIDVGSHWTFVKCHLCIVFVLVFVGIIAGIFNGNSRCLCSWFAIVFVFVFVFVFGSFGIPPLLKTSPLFRTNDTFCSKCALPPLSSMNNSFAFPQLCSREIILSTSVILFQPNQLLGYCL